MELHAWLDDKKGRARDLAAHLGVSKTAVSLWRANGIPVAYMPQIHDFTRGAVSIDEMVLHTVSRRAEARESAW
jgi:hypothetical protein